MDGEEFNSNNNTLNATQRLYRAERSGVRMQVEARDFIFS